MRARGKREWVYLLKSGDAVKVGRTVRLDNRIKELQTGSPHPLVVIRAFPVPAHRAPTAEKRIRDAMHEPMHGEWVKWQPGMERVADGVLLAFLSECEEAGLVAA
jgi:hypothetical protein